MHLGDKVAFELGSKRKQTVSQEVIWEERSRQREQQGQKALSSAHFQLGLRWAEDSCGGRESETPLGAGVRPQNLPQPPPPESLSSLQCRETLDHPPKYHS